MLLYFVTFFTTFIDTWPEFPCPRDLFMYSAVGPLMIMLHKIFRELPKRALLLKPFLSGFLLCCFAQVTSSSRIYTPNSIGAYMCFDIVLCIYSALVDIPQDQQHVAIMELKADNESMHLKMHEMRQYMHGLELQLHRVQVASNYRGDALNGLRSSRGRMNLQHIRGPHKSTNDRLGSSLWKLWIAYGMWRRHDEDNSQEPEKLQRDPFSRKLVRIDDDSYNE